jgi:hypothetical protein
MPETTFNPEPTSILAPDSGAVRQGGVIVDASRPRQTEAPATPFREVLAGSVSVLMGGAAVATHVLGAPRLAAAISGAGGSAAAAIAGSPTGAAAGAPGAAGTAGALVASSTGSDSSDLATMQAMQRESQVFNMQLLGLQEQVQQDNQRFTTLSNVLRAKHDTAKAAVSNIRS